MEKKYISESRYKKSTTKKRRDIKAIRHNGVKSVKASDVKSNTKKANKPKSRKKASVRREIRATRRNVLTCIILLILIAVIARALLKEEGEPFIPIFFGEEENEQVITVGVITTDDLLSSNMNNVVLKELGYYSNYMLLTINEDYSLEYDVIESIDKISNKEYVINLNKSRDYDASIIKQVLEGYIANAKSIYYDNLKEVETIHIVQDRTLKIILKEDNPYFVYNLDIPLIETGKKQYVKTNESTSSCIVYERTKYASKEAPRKIVVKRYKDMYEGVEAYKKQEINMLVTNQKNVQNILGKYEYNIRTYRNGETIFLFLNEGAELLKHEEIRKVIAYSIDRNSIIQDVMQSAASLIDLPYVYDTVKYKYDIYAAENLLLSNGYKKSNKVYAKNGKQVALTLIVNKADEEKLDIATAIKNNLTSVGVKVTVEKLSAAAIEKRIEKGTYDLVLSSVNLNNKPDVNFLMKHLYSTEETQTAFNSVKETSIGNIYSAIKNTSNAMSNSISCVGILAKTNYVIYSKDIVGVSDISYLNIFSSLVLK